MTVSPDQPASKPWRRAWTWADVAAAQKGRQLFRPSKAAERAYAAQLKDVARNVAKVLAAAPSPEHAQWQLNAYAEALEPWARQTAANMLRRVAVKNDASWRETAERWGIDMRGGLDADVTRAMRSRVEANVLLIKSLPGETALRVGELAQQAVLEGTRAEDLAARIQAAGDTAHSRAKTIAQTEVSKAGTALTQARAQAVGSEGYIWRTARDGKTRSSHRAMEGKFVKWSEPPTLDGMTGHAGEFPNCRCYPEPVVSDSKGEAVASTVPTRAEEEKSGEHKLRSQWERQEGSVVVPHEAHRALPNAERAIIPEGKLERYVLNPDHPRGGHKARVMSSALGFGPGDAGKLASQLLEQVRLVPAARPEAQAVTEFGEAFQATLPVTGPNGRTLPVRTNWIYDTANGGRSTRPRLVSAWVDL